MAGLMSVLAIVVGLVSGWYGAGPIFGAAKPAYMGSLSRIDVRRSPSSSEAMG